MTVLILTAMIIGWIHEDAKAQDTKLPLTIDPIYPKNQNPQTKGYFDLSVHSNEKQLLKVRITNNEAKQITVNIKPANAFTNPSGGMMYGKEINSPDTILLPNAIRMAKYIGVQKSVTVPPSSSAEIPITIKVPKTNGQTLLGGILFTMQGNQTEKRQSVKKGTANFVLKSETVYAVAMQLNLPNKVATHFLIGQAGFSPENGNVYIEMTNDSQKIQEGINGSYTISNESGKKLFDGNFGPFKMAPESKIRYPIQWRAKTIDNGNYIIMLNGNVDGTKFKVTKKFTIGSNDVKEYAQKNQSNLPQTNVNKGISKWVWIIGAILFGVIMFFIGRRRPTKKE